MEKVIELNDPSVEFGKLLANPPPGEEVVISGLSGQYPDSENVHQFRDNLFNKHDMVSCDNRRWEPGHPEIPQRSGKLPNISKFDAGFFGIHHRQATSMDPMVRVFMETTISAIFDAGLHPSDLEGTKTGVFVGACFGESEKCWFFEKLVPQTFAITGCERSMIANRISYFLKLKGPSFVTDTACSSSLYAFEHAYKAIREGVCDMAIVGGTNLCLHPFVSLQFARLGVLSPDGACKVFDKNGDGYARSEAVCAVLLQKAKEAKRVYATVLHAKTNSDGYKNSGITYPSGDMQVKLFTEFYQECSVKPTDMSFLEAHGTGTKVGDPEELQAIEEIFVKNRTTPLLVGSVKSNIGHTEPTSGLCSITKAIIALETGFIPPNLHFHEARTEMTALLDGRLKVVTEKTPFKDNRGLIGINSFGFGGGNCHILLKHNTRSKVNGGKPKDNVPRLVCVSGRTREAVDALLDDVINNGVDAEHIWLLQEAFRKDVSGHLYRGYLLASKTATIQRSVAPTSNHKELWVCFGTMDVTRQALEFMELPIVARTIQQVHLELEPRGINITEVFKTARSALDKVLINFTLQLSIADLLRASGLRPAKVYGVNLGQLVAAYYKGVVTLSEAVQCALNGTYIQDKLTMVPSSKQLVFEVGTSQNHHINSGCDLNSVLCSFGKLYQLGLNPQVQNFYPHVARPVTRATPMISPKIKWNHERDWWVTLYQCDDQMEIEEKATSITLKDSMYSFVAGHVIDGRNLFPATGYLQLVWETLAHVHGLMISDMKVVFENCKFERPCTVPEGDVKLDLCVMVQRGSGNFEVIEGGVPVVTGRIYQAKEEELARIPLSHGVPPYMDTKDIYKELRLRGYNYKGKFQGLISCDNTAQVAEISWDGNWITFIDNMLQIKILQEDTRMLYVPTRIKRLSIDAKKHIEFALGFADKEPQLPVHISKETGIIRCGCIEINGLHASSIARRRYLRTPVLEKHVFVPNVGTLTIQEAVRVNMQLLLENLYSVKVKAVELIDEATADVPYLGEIIYDVLADQPLIQSDITILSKSEIKLKNVKTEDKKLLTEIDCSLVVASTVLQRPNILHLAFGSIKENGFILSREPLEFDIATVNNPAVNVLTVFVTESEQLVFFTKMVERKIAQVIKISDTDKDFTWLPLVKTALENNKDLLLYAQEPLNGIMGLVNCIRREPGCQNIRLVFLPEDTPDFNPSHPFYQTQLRKNLAVNVYKSGQWGTYRHMLLDEVYENVEHCYLNTLQRGDLTSLSWIEGPLTCDYRTNDPGFVLVAVYYAALNFRDLMTASGRLNIDTITRDRREQEVVQGFEFSGRTKSGRRVYGMGTNGACASLILADVQHLWEIPDEWTFEEAATVPVVYMTCLYALFKKGRMRRGDSVLIHSGTGGIGQAAINLALHAGCTVYTTVGTTEKKEFLLKQYPQLKEKNICSSRNVQFEGHIMKMTQGKGVDVVLNSLAEEKLYASVRCLARGGRFVEIGKFDLANDRELNLLLLTRDASFHCFMLDTVVKTEALALLKAAMASGALRPLNRTVFKMSQAEEAFRYMATGKHMGKVLIEVRKENQKTVAPSTATFPAIPRYLCDPEKTYIICGGLGGFGLELADWLALRGCRKLVLTSRTGVRTGYQAYRLSIWKTYGCTVSISTEDITTYEGCVSLLKAANQLGPVHAIFNLAVVLKDAILANQTEDNFRISFNPKAVATKNLDVASRRLCPELRDLVVFSSVSCGRGNAGQSNYGMSNSVMERICEARHAQGLPAVAIQWGAVGDVGLVADTQTDSKELEIGGTLQQRISNCLQTLDKFLRQTEAVIVSSVVVAEKKPGGGADNIIDAVANILGVKDLKSISLTATLAEVGMDSMTAVEIKQTLEREYDVFLTAQDIKTMTFARLIEIQAEKDDDLPGRNDVDILLRMVPDEATCNLSTIPIIGQKSELPSPPMVVIFPGLEGALSLLQPIYENLKAELLGLQYPHKTQTDSLNEMAQQLLAVVETKLTNQPFFLLSYSFGGTVALEVMALLEARGHKGTLILIDSSPDYMKGLSKMLEVDSDESFQVSFIVHLMSKHVSSDVIAQHLDALYKCTTLEERISMGQQIVGDKIPHSPGHLRDCIVAVYKRMRAVVDWTPAFKLKSQVVLMRPTVISFKLPLADYGLSEYCEQAVKVHVFEGNHVSILENADLTMMVGQYLDGVI